MERLNLKIIEFGITEPFGEISKEKSLENSADYLIRVESLVFHKIS